MSKPVALGIAPLFDEATKYSYEWFRHAWDSTKDKLEWECLVVDDATRDRVEEKLREKNYDLVVFYDHGDENSLVAQGGQSAVIDKNNLPLVRNSTGVIYSMSCLSARGLGVEFWKQNGVFVGYTDVFGFTTTEQELFRDAANSGLLEYANGERDWKRIKQKMVEAFNNSIKLAREAWTKIWLTHDRDSLVVYDGEAPTSRCMFRKIALKLFGERLGWALTWSLVLAYILFGLGLGLSVHDFFVECSDPLRFPPHGFWLGVFFIIVSVIMLSSEYLKTAVRKRKA
ncbi:MAG: hypothetical protein QXT14_08825 [Candidatus Bathyarchaeia archaeon]